MVTYEGRAIDAAEMQSRTGITEQEFKLLLKPLFVFMQKHDVLRLQLFRDGMHLKALVNFEADDEQLQRLEEIGQEEPGR